MDIFTFITALFESLATIEAIKRVDSHSEGPTVRGRAYLNDHLFLAFYYNQMTGTQAFALVQGSERLWGIDYDNLRGWHEHPFGNPEQHISISAQSLATIIHRCKDILSNTRSASE